MPRISYRPQSFYAKSLERLGWINQILDDFAERGFRASVRQIHYQVVAHGWMENTPATYNAIQGLIDNGRMAGVIDWDAIEDRNREVVGWASWPSVEAHIRETADSHRVDPWERQRIRVEVVIEKAALTGVIEGVCAELRVPYLAARGYNSQSLAWEMGHEHYREDPREIVVLYLGDHDPSGINMARELQERFELFAERKIELRRLALNLDQTRNLPPQFAKETDTRFAQYVEEFGTEESWELDALDPDLIVELLEREIQSLIDPATWEEEMERERTERVRFHRIAKRERGSK